VGFYRFDSNGGVLAEFASPAIEARAVIEGQFMSMYIHATRMGMKVTSLLATGS
jgi:hypothetical protein